MKYFEKNPKLDIKNLCLITQIIIDRILFIRVCEARKLEEVGLLKKYQKAGFLERI